MPEYDEVTVLRSLLSAYVDDEDRFLLSAGEPYGSIPVEVGLAAREARKRHLANAPAQKITLPELPI